MVSGYKIDQGSPYEPVLSLFALSLFALSFMIRVLGSVSSEPGSSEIKVSKTSLWSGFSLSGFSIFETHGEPKVCGRKGSNGWTQAMKRVMNGGSMRRFQERVLGQNKTGISSSTSDIWLLGVCYKISQEGSSSDSSDGVAAFVEDFSSRILLTYRKGFDAIGDSKYTSDVNWGCMLRSSQMLVAQPLHKEYFEILQLFGDSEASAFSIHNILQAGNGYDLAAGSRGARWSPSCLCRRCFQTLFEYSKGQANWTPVLLLVPLVLGLDKVNPSLSLPLLESPAIIAISHPATILNYLDHHSSATFAINHNHPNLTPQSPSIPPCLKPPPAIADLLSLYLLDKTTAPGHQGQYFILIFLSPSLISPSFFAPHPVIPCDHHSLSPVHPSPSSIHPHPKWLPTNVIKGTLGPMPRTTLVLNHPVDVEPLATHDTQNLYESAVEPELVATTIIEA
ncbi:peptidase family C54 protein [Actinidia rufa]|uniref:Cysteine protease n=1 Tax=Actinidia rufa TaxID=165716 RepID=A0A7J0FEP1_9ERIC|nr:peptidase family C54 protein [Actinidia rufa]